MKRADASYLIKVKQRYRLSAADYYALLELQEGRCAICQTHVDRLPRRLDVDHDHKTGVVRGLLCHPCNVGLGHHERHNTGAWAHYRAHPPMAQLRYLRETPHDQQVHVT